jgi:hypothetical protein
MLDEANLHYLKSVTAYCPMVNLQQTMEYHSRVSFSEAGVDIWNRIRLQALPGRVPRLRETEFWKTPFDFKPRFMPAVLNYLEATQHRPGISLPENIVWPKGLKEHLETSKSFFELNNFWPFYVNNRTPFLILTTPRDPLVPNELNTELIASKKQSGHFEKTQILRMDRGVHCALPVEYQWSFVMDLMRAQWGAGK